MFLFNTYFWDQLPSYFGQNDTYKNLSGQGLLQRYLGIYGVELDEGIIPYIEEFLDQVDPDTAEDKFLTYIAITLGSPLDIFNNSSKFSKLLKYIIAIYKIKGTSKSYEIYFKILGLSLYLVEHFDNLNVLYDDDREYDDDTDDILYDENCTSCSDYSLYVKDDEQECIPSNPVVLETIVPDPLDWVLNILTLDGNNDLTSNTSNTANYARQLGIITPNTLYRVIWETTQASNSAVLTVNLGGNSEQYGGVPPLPPLPHTYIPVSAVGTYEFFILSGSGTDLEVKMTRPSFPPTTFKGNITLERIEPIEWAYVLTDELRATLSKIICFLQPINAKLRDLEDSITACEELAPFSSELVVIQKLETPTYDEGELTDESVIYDGDIMISADYFGDESLLQYPTATGGTISTVGDDKVHVINLSTDFVVTSAGDLGIFKRALVVGAGGGGGSSTNGTGGGGAGGRVREVTDLLLSPGAYPVVVGTKGAKGLIAGATDGGDGTSSSFAGIVSEGGPGGAKGSGGGAQNGKNGYQGSGGGYQNGTGGTGTSGRNGGNAGGNVGGGGAGAGASGSNGVSSTGGAGGAGVTNDITGSSIEYGKGGKAGDYANPTTDGVNPTNNRGHGGDSGQRAGLGDANGADGSDGVVIIRYQFQ